jgi:hypothetical protein
VKWRKSLLAKHSIKDLVLIAKQRYWRTQAAGNFSYKLFEQPELKSGFSDHEIQIVDSGGGVGQALPDRLTWHWLDGVHLLRCPQRGRRAMSGGNR